MFGIGFTELLLIAIIAILFLGPDKLPGALTDMAKFIKSVKKTIGDAKASLEEEMKIADLKEEALNYKKQLDETTDELKNFKNIGFEEDIIYDDKIAETSSAIPIEAKNETVTLKKKKITKKEKETTPKNKKSDA